jgi:phosphoglycolate phosphatase-like HAD superfamily hydrolase
MNKTKKISVIIFDCDGVMFDSRQANINFYNSLLGHFGLPPMVEKEIEFVHMHTASESVRHIFRETSYVEQANEYRMRMDYAPFIKDMVMEPGLKELLKWLVPRFGLAVATNRSNTIGDVLNWNGLSPYFDIVISSLDVANPKPHPESLIKILDFFKIGPDQAIYVGDSLVDYETAKAASVPFVAYKSNALQADYHVGFLGEIRELVG